MNYEEKYKEALERARIYRDNAKSVGEYSAVARYENIFPELRESEDEKFRKYILQCCKECIEANDKGLELSMSTTKKLLSWLEKQEDCILVPKSHLDPVGKLGVDGIKILEEQKEQNEELVYRLNGLMQDYIKEGKDEVEKEHRFKCYQLFWDALEDTSYFEQKEQKPVDANHIVNAILSALSSGLETDEILKARGFTYDEVEKWLNSTRNPAIEYIRGQNKIFENPEKYGLCKPVKWSEEDEKNLELVTDCVYEFYPDPVMKYKLKDWLKSLRPQPHTVSIKDATKFGNLEYERGVKDGIQHAENHRWKPGEEQLSALLWCIAHLGGADRRVLAELYEHLKMYCK